jgi:hypothetical protein
MMLDDYTKEELESMPTLCTGQCCSLKVETSTERLWICRVGGGISIERYARRTGRWKLVEGGCTAEGEEEDVTR